MQKQGKKKDIRKKLLVILAGFLALLMLLPIIFNVLISAQAANQSISSLKKDAQELAQQKKEISNKIKSLSNNKAKVMDQKQALDEQNDIIQKEIGNTNALIQSYDSRISQKEVELKKAKEKEAVQYQLFCARVRSMEENGPVSYLSVVFGAKNFSDLLDRVTMIQEIMEYDNGIMKSLAATRQEIADTKTTLENSQAEKEQAKAELVNRQTELSQQIQKAQNLVAQMESDTAEYQASYAKLDAEDDAISAKIDQLVAEQERREREQQQSNSNGSGTGSGTNSGTKIVSESGFQWPLNGYHSITSSYGMRRHPIAGVMRMHTGVDIAAPSGTPIHATKSGQVLISSYGGSYGNYVCISHGGGDSSLYAHMSSRAVSAGQSVSQGQVIGYVGSTGDSTGSHLHFEIRINGSRVNPLSVF